MRPGAWHQKTSACFTSSSGAQHTCRPGLYPLSTPWAWGVGPRGDRVKSLPHFLNEERNSKNLSQGMKSLTCHSHGLLLLRYLVKP